MEGYAPSAVQYDGTVEEVPGAGAGGGTGAAVVAPAPAPAAAPKALPKTAPKVSSVSVSVSVASPAERIDQSIQTLLKYRTAGAGGAALKLLLTFVKNVADSPSELKYVRLLYMCLLPLLLLLLLLPLLLFSSSSNYLPSSSLTTTTTAATRFLKMSN